MDQSEFRAWLAEDDEASREYRCRRLRLLVEEFGGPHTVMLSGGLVSSLAFEEARRAYLQGLDIATVLLAQTTLEHLLGGLLRQAVTIPSVGSRGFSGYRWTDDSFPPLSSSCSTGSAGNATTMCMPHRPSRRTPWSAAC